MMFYPDWLWYIEVLCKSVFYVGIGFALITHFLFKWLELISN